jgi:hypothetical protein
MLSISVRDRTSVTKTMLYRIYVQFFNASILFIQIILNHPPSLADFLDRKVYTSDTGDGLLTNNLIVLESKDELSG